MAIRFTEFIEHDDHAVNLYIVQEAEQDDNLRFKIHVKDGDMGSLVLCKNEGDDWKFSPQNNPDWLDDIKPQVVSAIEKRLSKDNGGKQHFRFK